MNTQFIKIRWTILLALLIFISCQKDDSKKDYGSSLIYMPQSVNFSLGLNAVYPVPASSNGSSPTGMNYVVDTVTGKTKIILGTSLSGKSTGAYSVSIGVNNDTVQQLINNGTLGADYIAMPSSGYSLPSTLDVPESGNATFYLEIDNNIITNPDYLGKHLVVAVKLSNSSRYTIDESKATTIVDLNIAGLFPTATDVSSYNINTGDTITITGQNLEKITAINFFNTNVDIPILSQSSTSMKVIIPGMSSVNRSTLDFVTPFGTTQSSFELINVANAMQVFTDNYGTNIGPNTDGDDYGSSQSISSSVAKRGSASLAIKYFANNYSPGGLLNMQGFVNANYQYITFWAKSTTSGTDNGGIQLALMGDGMATGYAQDFAGIGIVVTSDWKYYKIPIGSSSTNPMWSTGNSFRKFGWRLNNWNVPNDEVVYFDDVLFVK